MANGEEKNKKEPTGPSSGRRDRKKKRPCGTGSRKVDLEGKELEIAKANDKQLWKCVSINPPKEPWKEKEREEPGMSDDR